MAHTWLSDLSRQQLRLADDLQRKTQRTLDAVLGEGQALALVDCQLMPYNYKWLRREMVPSRLATIPPYQVKQIRASVVLGHHPPQQHYPLLDEVGRLTQDTLGIDRSRGDQLDVFQLP